MSFIEKKPIKRSELRLLMGKEYYTFRRYLKWYLCSKKYSKEKSDRVYPYLIFTHSTPLLRKLKGVDMHLQYNKIINLKLASVQINGIIIKPGEIFSYWRLIGKPTYKKGYLDGLVLSADGSFKSGAGGGLCQLSNLIYWTVLHSPLTVIERYRHSHDVFPDVNRTQPFGTGATCAYNYLDLQIENRTNNKYQFITYLTEDKLIGELRSDKEAKYRYDIYEKEHSITPGIFGGYVRNNTIYRRTYNLYDELIKDEYITENHAYMMYAPFLEAAANRQK
ncbi:MAG: VanW family protein [Bacillota bacterium]|nr:VanW family protein [Bacillota bacterium]